MKRYYWKAYAPGTRSQAITLIERTISRHGFLVDFKMFSDISLSMFVEIEKGKIEPLALELGQLISLEGDYPPASDAIVECSLLINVTFVQGTGRMEMDVPQVPG